MPDVVNVYKEAAVKAVLIALLLLAAGGALLYPLYTEAVDLEQQINDRKLDLERQKIFTPEFEQYQAMSAEGAEVHYPVPDPEPIFVRDIGTIPESVEFRAREAGLKILDVILSPGSLKQGKGRLKLQAVVSGTDGQFRDFYFNLGEWAALAYVERLEVQAVPGGLEYLVEFWVHITEKAG